VVWSDEVDAARTLALVATRVRQSAPFGLHYHECLEIGFVASGRATQVRVPRLPDLSAAAGERVPRLGSVRRPNSAALARPKPTCTSHTTRSSATGLPPS